MVENIKIMTIILESAPLSKDLRELDPNLKEWAIQNRVLEDMWDKNLLSIKDDVYYLKPSKGKKVVEESKWCVIRKQLNLDIPLSEVNKQCGARFSPSGRTEGLINILLNNYTIKDIVKGLENIVNLKIRNGEIKYLAGLDVYLHSSKFPILLELEENNTNFNTTL